MDKIKKIIFILFSVFILPITTNAASLYLNPSTGSYDTGSVFPVSIYVSSPNEEITAASGEINFSKEDLEVVSLSKISSIFSSWIEEPSFSNVRGTVSFDGIISGHGFTGNSGKILTVNFKAKKAGKENVVFSSNSVLANNGASLISNAEAAQFSIVSIEDDSIPAPITKAPSAPNISSSTHGDQSKWYNSNNVKLSWDISSDVDKMRTLLNKSPNSLPSILYDSPVNEKEINDLDDGIWYFHIQFRNKLGWGDVTHFKIQIDTKEPDSFKINIIKGKEGETSRPVIGFKTTDSMSGIDYYKIRIEKDSFIVSKEEMEDGEYTLPDQSAGNKALMIQAFDKAGNYFPTAEEFTVNSLESPIITEYPKELSSEDFLNIKGTSKYPQSQINIYFEKDKKPIGTKKINTDSFGNFNLAYEGNLKNGVYDIKAEVVDVNGLKSIDNQTISIIVKNSDSVKNKLELIVIAVSLIFLVLVIIVWFVFRKIHLSKKKLKKEFIEAENKVKESFESIKTNLCDNIEVLLKNKNERDLTKEEEEIIEKLKKSIDCLDKLMKK
jgi:hypothetical protein